MGIWWGSNLVGARVAPVRLSDQTKLVYSPHVYGPSVYQQAYFNDLRFPSNSEGASLASIMLLHLMCGPLPLLKLQPFHH